MDETGLLSCPHGIVGVPLGHGTAGTSHRSRSGILTCMEIRGSRDRFTLGDAETGDELARDELRSGNQLSGQKIEHYDAVSFIFQAMDPSHPAVICCVHLRGDDGAVPYVSWSGETGNHVDRCQTGIYPAVIAIKIPEAYTNAVYVSFTNLSGAGFTYTAWLEDPASAGEKATFATVQSRVTAQHAAGVTR
jgi:hypothetical protein